MSVVHVLRGYTTSTDRLAVQYDVPDDLMKDVVRHVTLEEGDSDVFGVYHQDKQSTLAIARLIGKASQVAKELSELDFFLEA